MEAGNIFAAIPRPSEAEDFATLLEAPSVKIERIVSTGQATPPGEWLDQGRAEWVVLLKGTARVLFEGETVPHILGEGDWLLIPPHARHRVEWTAPAQPTVWLAIHYV